MSENKVTHTILTIWLSGCGQDLMELVNEEGLDCLADADDIPTCLGCLEMMCQRQLCLGHA